MVPWKLPWHYLTWRPPALCAEQEIALARMIRREGLLRMQRLFWGLLTRGEGFPWPFWDIALGYNWPILLIGAGWAVGLADMGWLAALWGVTWVVGTVRYAGWLLWLLHRWPPVSMG
jgi:hypothetical protein